MLRRQKHLHIHAHLVSAIKSIRKKSDLMEMYQDELAIGQKVDGLYVYDRRVEP